jgi:hypothetical protein
MDTQIRTTFKNYLIAGVGFGVGLVAVVLAAMYVIDWLKGAKQFSEKAGVVVKEHRLVRTPNNASVIGQVSNTGDRAWRYVKLTAEFQNASGLLVEKCGETIDGVLRPGQTRNFKLDCYGRKDQPMPSFDKYSIAITDALTAE